MLQFTINSDRDPNGTSLRRLLEAHVVYERMAAAKGLSLYLLAVVGVVVWSGAEWPFLIPSRLLDAALALWMGLFFFAMLARLEEWIWNRKVADYRNQHQTRQNDDDGLSR